MISSENKSTIYNSSNYDFTVKSYRYLVRLALKNYVPVDYRNIVSDDKFILWRHDCDFSLDQSLTLAQIEHEEKLKSTYFLNPHNDVYNLLHRDQLRLVEKILLLGHDIGLHFDMSFYEIRSEQDLNQHVAYEAGLLTRFLGVSPVAFSFHNPTSFHLNYESDTYGGLLNCYSKRFKLEIPYCSDSNGYWRFRRLYDVLSGATDPCLQVLTHPEWWQEKPMPPRQRIFRSIYGRARATLRFYDQGLEDYGRVNMAGEAQALRFLESIDPDLFVLCDYLWNTERFSTLFLELWRIHEKQIVHMCKAALQKQMPVSPQEVDILFDSNKLTLEGWNIFKIVFDNAWITSNLSDTQQYYQWAEVKSLLLLGREIFAREHLEAGCLHLCNLILSLAEWGQNHVIAYDGLSPLSSIDLAPSESSDGGTNRVLGEMKDGVRKLSGQEWEDLKNKLGNPSARDKHNK